MAYRRALAWSLWLSIIFLMTGAFGCLSENYNVFKDFINNITLNMHFYPSRIVALPDMVPFVVHQALSVSRKIPTIVNNSVKSEAQSRTRILLFSEYLRCLNELLSTNSIQWSPMLGRAVKFVQKHRASLYARSDLSAPNSTFDELVFELLVLENLDVSVIFVLSRFKMALTTDNIEYSKSFVCRFFICYREIYYSIYHKPPSDEVRFPFMLNATTTCEADLTLFDQYTLIYDDVPSLRSYTFVYANLFKNALRNLGMEIWFDLSIQELWNLIETHKERLMEPAICSEAAAIFKDKSRPRCSKELRGLLSLINTGLFQVWEQFCQKHKKVTLTRRPFRSFIFLYQDFINPYGDKSNEAELSYWSSLSKTVAEYLSLLPATAFPYSHNGISLPDCRHSIFMQYYGTIARTNAGINKELVLDFVCGQRLTTWQAVLNSSLCAPITTFFRKVRLVDPFHKIFSSQFFEILVFSLCLNGDFDLKFPKMYDEYVACRFLAIYHRHKEEFLSLLSASKRALSSCSSRAFARSFNNLTLEIRENDFDNVKANQTRSEEFLRFQLLLVTIFYSSKRTINLVTFMACVCKVY